MSGTGKGLYQTQRTVSGATRHRQREERDEELERLCRLVKGLELEVRGRRRRRDRDDQKREVKNGGNRYGAGSNQFGSRQRRSRSHSQESHQYRDRSHPRGSRRHRNWSLSRELGQCRDRSRSRENQVRNLVSQEEGRPRNAAMNAMSRALRKVARSPFSDDIERAEMPSRFTRPPFNCYNGKTDPVEHVSHYIQIMSLHTHNDALIYKVFLPVWDKPF